MITGIRQQAIGNSKKLNLVVCALCAVLLGLCVSADAQQPLNFHGLDISQEHVSLPTTLPTQIEMHLDRDCGT